MNTRPHRRAFAVSALAAATGLALSGLNGCSASLLPKPPPAAARYTLDAAADAPSAQATAPDGAPVLLLAQPSVAPGYDTVRMLYRRQPQQLEAFAFHEWLEPPARLLAPLMLRALQACGAFRAVLLAPTSGAGDLRLETELLRLHQDFSVQPSVLRLTLRAVLIDTATRRVMASQVFDATAAASRDDPLAGVAAAQQATQRLLGELAAACANWARGVPSAQGAPISTRR
jgi:cholesterol transport system auxiliary component